MTEDERHFCATEAGPWIEITRLTHLMQFDWVYDRWRCCDWWIYD